MNISKQFQNLLSGVAGGLAIGAVALSLGCLAATFLFQRQYAIACSAISQAKVEAYEEAGGKAGDIGKYHQIMARKTARVHSPEFYYRRAQDAREGAMVVWILSVTATFATRRWVPVLLVSLFTFISIVVLSPVRY
jgi:hypothetical protein